LRLPPNVPMAVRTALTTTTSLLMSRSLGESNVNGPNPY